MPAGFHRQVETQYDVSHVKGALWGTWKHGGEMDPQCSIGFHPVPCFLERCIGKGGRERQEWRGTESKPIGLVACDLYLQRQIMFV